MLSFIIVDSFSAEVHKFEKKVLFRSLPYHFYSKTDKNMALMEKSTHVERHYLVSTETLWNYT